VVCCVVVVVSVDGEGGKEGKREQGGVGEWATGSVVVLARSDLVGEWDVGLCIYYNYREA
jgi:hypothetical protein